MHTGGNPVNVRSFRQDPGADMKFTKAMLVSSAVLVGACAGGQGLDRNTTGLIGGGAGLLLGGWVGSHLGSGTGKLMFTGLGAVIGGPAGYEIGRGLGRSDHAAYKNAVVAALETPGGKADWRNDETGVSGFVTTTGAYRDGNDMPCQAFRATVAVPDDEIVSGDGAACRDESGDWTLVADAFR